ncbi:hypothetical protein [Nocardiopsis sp. HUAS JQ3]|uniref:hypothetical protein n=1 Tax=Nocardiopsis sp. HUAS JQ3 TaxID=3061629 RepID=UPI0023A91B6F|nr:hypothetical protein [Nocardiopsis sp. HUAS JQ3]WDZ90559.1 hypothetical protein PV789_27345 [Nocardiopsis sp. HUAS JQ3]
MFDVAWTVFDLDCLEWEYALALTGLCVTVTLIGIVNRTSHLLSTYYVRGQWPGMVHHDERGPGTICGPCGHHLAAHDRATGRCCHGTPLDHLAMIIALPMPLLVRDMLQQAGCPCRLKGKRP